MENLNRICRISDCLAEMIVEAKEDFYDASRGKDFLDFKMVEARAKVQSLEEVYAFISEVIK